MLKLSFLAILFFLSIILSAQDFSGMYNAYNSSNGTKITITLNQNPNGLVSGELILNDNQKYKLNGKIEEDEGESYLTGSIIGEDENSFFEAYSEENQLIFTWVPSDRNNQPNYMAAIDILLDKSSSSNNNFENRQTDTYKNYSENYNDNDNKKSDNYQRDPMLVGAWRYSKSYVSGDFSMVTERYMEVRADGTYSYSDGKVAGGGNSGSFNSGNGGDVITGKWRTENGIIYIDENGYGNWVPYSGYYVEGNRLMLKFSDNSKEIWERI
ncbi:MAG: hypothetical protein P8X73_16890 [Ignavibacteriaceae bacterium]